MDRTSNNSSGSLSWVDLNSLLPSPREEEKKEGPKPLDNKEPKKESTPPTPPKKPPRPLDSSCILM